MQGWLTDYEKLVSGLSNIAAVMSLGIGAVALFFTGWQIRRNSKQLKAKTIYDIQRDGREAARLMLSDQAAASEILGMKIGRQEQVGAVIGQLFNFYSSVYYQKQLGILDTGLWSPFEEEMHFLLSGQAARCFWKRKRATCEYDPEFTCTVDRILAELREAASKDKG